jgi:hypothetical protein
MIKIGRLIWKFELSFPQSYIVQIFELQVRLYDYTIMPYRIAQN